LTLPDRRTYAPNPADQTVETKVSMSIESRSRGIRITQEGDSTHVLDVHCGECAACRGSADYWCLEERPDGPELLALKSPVETQDLRRWLGALAALATTKPATGTVLLVLRSVEPLAVAALARPWHDGPVLTSSDGRDDGVRDRLRQLSPTGRAQTVLALDHARTAVRAVQRGGQVCLPDVAVDAPSVTELVQRDVRLIAPRRIRDLAVTTTWTELGRRLDEVLATGTTPVRAGL
jgi:hypothetical protein